MDKNFYKLSCCWLIAVIIVLCCWLSYCYWFVNSMFDKQKALTEELCNIRVELSHCKYLKGK